MIFKLIVFIGALIAVYYFFIRKLIRKERDDKSIEMLVECDTCGTFVSNKEATLSSGKYFCSKECLEKKA